MIKNIIIEGPDNCGKSTLIDNYRNKARCIVRHFTAPKTKTSDEQYLEQMTTAYNELHHLENLSISNKPIVLLNDRSIFGELVYSKFRGYVPNYFDDIVSKMKVVPNVQTLFVIIYFDKHSIEKYNVITKDDCKENYAKIDKYEEISCAFISEIHKLNYGRVLVINSNNFNNFTERNTLIYKHIDTFINDTNYKFEQTNDYANTPFNDNQTVFSAGSPFYDRFLNQPCTCQDFSTCELGKQHLQFSLFGMKHGRPTSAYGSLKPKYVFVGEAPGHKGCGKFGIPFYNDVSGILFQQMLYNLNISPFDVYVTNTIKCCPQNNDLGDNYKLQERLKLLCVKQLYNELILVSPNKTIYAIGRIAYDTLKSIPQFKCYDIIFTYHPAYFTRMGNSTEYTEYMEGKIKFHIGD